eukprot:TRINITY_DN9272_c0_g1_i1.p1 TRINITY_DN9272_c0_g1~~TRINITY_DN9272_c0_g1_i1.p1  ORF type:complete len:578 (+),score=152.12 TRINITY_DN9272_c0_g1_i1:118-1851(+)
MEKLETMLGACGIADEQPHGHLGSDVNSPELAALGPPLQLVQQTTHDLTALLAPHLSPCHLVQLERTCRFFNATHSGKAAQRRAARARRIARCQPLLQVYRMRCVSKSSYAALCAAVKAFCAAEPEVTGPAGVQHEMPPQPASRAHASNATATFGWNNCSSSSNNNSSDDVWVYAALVALADVIAQVSKLALKECPILFCAFGRLGRHMKAFGVLGGPSAPPKERDIFYAALAQHPELHLPLAELVDDRHAQVQLLRAATRAVFHKTVALEELDAALKRVWPSPSQQRRSAAEVQLQEAERKRLQSVLEGFYRFDILAETGAALLSAVLAADADKAALARAAAAAAQPSASEARESASAERDRADFASACCVLASNVLKASQQVLAVPQGSMLAITAYACKAVLAFKAAALPARLPAQLMPLYVPGPQAVPSNATPEAATALRVWSAHAAAIHTYLAAHPDEEQQWRAALLRACSWLDANEWGILPTALLLGFNYNLPHLIRCELPRRFTMLAMYLLVRGHGWGGAGRAGKELERAISTRAGLAELFADHYARVRALEYIEPLAAAYGSQQHEGADY